MGFDRAGICAFLGKDWECVQETISCALASDIGTLNQLNSSVLGNGGKQLRPILGLLAARACAGGRASAAACNVAAAAELLHTATLMHDDVADRSEQRRGKPTIMSLMGPSVSVLVGDFWLVRAIGLILETGEKSGTIIPLFAKTLSDLAEGEMLQLQKAEDCDTTHDDYWRIIYSKTASLFEATAVSAAIAADAAPEAVRAMRTYASALGKAFQIRDDIMDYTHDSIQLGKPSGADLCEHKITLPLLEALDAAGEEEAARIRAMIRLVEPGSGPRQEIVDFVRDHGGVEAAQARLQAFVSEAVEALDALEPSKERDILRAMAGYVGSRNS